MLAQDLRQAPALGARSGLEQSGSWLGSGLKCQEKDRVLCHAARQRSSAQ